MAPGIKVSQITALANDIARALAAVNVRIVAPVPGKNTVGIEVPNAQKEKVRLKELMQLAARRRRRKMAHPAVPGQGRQRRAAGRRPGRHAALLIAGTTGSGKIVCINSIIMSIMYTQRPDQVKLILVDPKMVEMAAFKDIPHLMCPVDHRDGQGRAASWNGPARRWTSATSCSPRPASATSPATTSSPARSCSSASSATTEEEQAKIPKHLPYIVIIIDELADLMMTSGKEVESLIVRLAQKARAVGIHLILATQRPQATVVTGLIKANMPCRIAFRVASKMDSRIVLDQNGAEVLLGQGDMLFLPGGRGKPIRAQGTYIDDKEIRDSVKLVAAAGRGAVRAGTGADQERQHRRRRRDGAGRAVRRGRPRRPGEPSAAASACCSAG